MARFKGLRRGEATIAHSVRAQRIMRFIKRKPQPVKLVGETEEGEELTVAVHLGTSSAPITDPTLAVMDCVKIRAFDKDGALLRVLELDPDDPELQAEAELADARGGGRRGSSTPIISVDVPKLVDNIAKNMKEVFIAGGEHQSKAFKEGFNAMTNVVNLCLSMLVRVEARLANVEQDREELLAEATEATPENPQNALAMQALKSAMTGGPAPNGVDATQAAQLAQFMKQFQQGGPPNGSG
ncbi:MAG TPA: hypothetical protein VGQ57_06075 [Polyangiaceae bacterium]|jgi:hypothetical protein|nr:hypothetical protein [Polyangiaceae bacterium]